MPHDLINAKPISAAIKEFFGSSPAVAVHGPDQPAVRDHAQAARLGPRTGRPDARARRLRSARRAPDPLRPRLPDRDAGRPEHRPDQLARAVRAHQRVRLPRDAVPQGERQQGDRRDRLPVGDRGRQVRHRAGERVARQERQARPTTLVSCRVKNEFDADVARAKSQYMDVAPSQIVSVAASLDPVPRARRRQPRADGLQHAAPGGAVPAPREAAGRHRRRAHRRGRLGHRASSRCAAAWSTTSTPTASWCA